MNKTLLKISLSKFDEARFGIRTAHAANITQENLEDVLNFCKENQVVFLVARCETRDIRAVNNMQGSGFLLMDTLIQYCVNVDDISEPDGVEFFSVQPVQPGEADTVQAIALEAFKGYPNHYHADKKLDPEKCDGIYASMVYDACLKVEENSIIHVCKIDEEIVGFDFLHIPSPGVGEGVLKAVTPSAQKIGVGHSFTSPKKAWYQSKGVSVLCGSTQITNISSQNHMILLGFHPSASQYTFHKWFD